VADYHRTGPCHVALRQVNATGQQKKKEKKNHITKKKKKNGDTRKKKFANASAEQNRICIEQKKFSIRIVILNK
jgi:hypothetical protein